tara:strand:+ start:5680 stop:6246 length:567 start_codon:yes stop_codon:yes gene_type:complete
MKFSKDLFNQFKSKTVENIQNVKANEIQKLFDKIKKIKKRNKKVLIFGNGAGQSIADHFSVDITKNAKIKSLTFSGDNHLTCYANDYGYEKSIVKTIENYADKQDLIILISASGNSENMVKAAKFCNQKKISFFSITGFEKKSKLKKISKNNIFVNSKSFNIVEIVHLYILIQIVDLMKGKLIYSNKL